MYIINGNEESTDSTNQKLMDCWVKLRDFGWVYFHRAEAREFYISRSGRNFSVPATQFYLEETFPKVNRMINSSQGTGMLRRIPQRQWSLGLRHGLIGLFMPNNRNTRLDLNFRTINEIVNPTYPDFKNAVKICKQSGNSVAFNELYAIKYDSTNNNFSLCRNTINLGTITEKQEITLLDSTTLFIPEIVEELPNAILNS
jgi:hypothetical protein